MNPSKLVLAASLVLSLVAAILSATSLLLTTRALDQAPSMSTGFEAQVRAYLLDNPDVIIESVQRQDEQRAAAKTNEIKTAIAENANEILSSPSSPVMGNLEGDVSIVEFFDYNCPYCRKAAPILAEATAADPKLRLVFKEWPILGPGSQFAARAALASRAQGKYEPFHQAMMAYSGQVDEGSTLEIAAKVGIDVERLRRDMDDPAIASEIERNLALAGTLRITGTPSFVIGDEVVRGLVDLTVLQQYVADARKAPGD